MKGKILRHTINKTIERNIVKVNEIHEKKLEALKRERLSRDNITLNPNTIIMNLSKRVLSNEEYETLQYGLKHGLYIKPKEYNILASSESVWKQIEKPELCTDDQHSKGRAKVA